MSSARTAFKALSRSSRLPVFSKVQVARLRFSSSGIWARSRARTSSRESPERAITRLTRSSKGAVTKRVP